MKNFAKGIIGFIMFLSIFFNSIKVNADLIWEPYDSFYLGHKSDCERVYRQFIAVGPKGKVTLYESPVSHKKVAAYENGVTFLIFYTYTDRRSVEWGYTETFQLNPDIPKTTGWIHMDDLELIYDNISFCEEHESEFKEYHGEFDSYREDTYSGSYEIVAWSYPGSGIANGTVPKTMISNKLQYTYKDADDRQWAYYQYRDRKWEGAWICITDPTNVNIPAADPNQPTIIPASTVLPLAVENDENSEILALGIGIIIIIAVTAILIRVFWKTNSKNKKE